MSFSKCKAGAASRFWLACITGGSLGQNGADVSREGGIRERPFASAAYSRRPHLQERCGHVHVMTVAHRPRRAEDEAEDEEDDATGMKGVKANVPPALEKVSKQALVLRAADPWSAFVCMCTQERKAVHMHSGTGRRCLERTQGHADQRGDALFPQGDASCPQRPLESQHQCVSDVCPAAGKSPIMKSVGLNGPPPGHVRQQSC